MKFELIFNMSRYENLNTDGVKSNESIFSNGKLSMTKIDLHFLAGDYFR